MKTALYIATTALLLLAFQRCADDTPTEPPPPTQKDTTSHEFIWEVDTLFRPGTNDPAFFTAKAIYATSATNVYMVGYSTGLERCWHWDGEEWSVLNLGTALGGHIVDVDGLDSSYIVFASWYHGTHVNTGIITYEDGNITMLPWPKGDRNPRTCVHVAARDEIYLGSVQGVQRYNGTEWEWLLDSTETIGNEFYPQYIHKFPDGTLELVTIKHADALSNAVQWRWKNEQFVVVDSFPTEIKDYDANRFGYSIFENEENVLATGLSSTFLWQEGEWQKILDVGGSLIAGTKDNTFIGWQLSNFWHYNGSTTKHLWNEMQQQVPGFRRINAMTFIDSVLFVCGEISPTIRDVVVLRGRQVKSE
ncbi:MAG: hypothetical protein CL946_01975 [Ectothiorhodospiraceae bacterium]|nr:hypothetical protein [Ectothiorhodospiraceae bacterium]